MRSRLANIGLFSLMTIFMFSAAAPTTAQAQGTALHLSNFELSRDADQHLKSIRSRTEGLIATAGRLPEAMKDAAAELVVQNEPTSAGLALRLLLLWLGGWLAERLFWWWSTAWARRISDSPLATLRQRFAAQSQRFLFAQTLILSFAIGACLSYLFAAPPGMAGVMALDALLAIVAVRSARALGRFLFAPGAPRLRLVALPTAAAWRVQHCITILAVTVAAGLLLSSLLRSSEAQPDLADAVTSLTLLVAAVLIPAAVGGVILSLRGAARRPPRPAAVALGLVPAASWLLMQAGLTTAAWALLLIGLAPASSLALADAARTIAFGPARSGVLTREERIVSRAARNVALIAALLLITEGPPGSRGGLSLPLTTEIVTTLLILLGTDLAWQIARGLIDRGLASTGTEPGADRLATILPAFRTAVLAALAVTAVLSVASAFGLRIGPLLAGAGVIGLTIGFGAQALVRDVIAGFFLLLDDAFRVGETIESGNLQGQVEAFSLRSVRLRDDNGHMHTVAFGELKAVTNYSRDWAGLEVPVFVAHAVPYEAAAEMIEAAIAAVEADDTLSGLLLEPIRFSGATALTEKSVRLAISIRTLPGSQTKVRSAFLRQVVIGAALSDVALGASQSVVN